MRVTRRPYIDAPRGDAIHAYGQCYAALTGDRMVESVVHHAFDGNYYYTRRLYRRVSRDGGQTWREHADLFTGEAGAAQTTERVAPRHFLDPVTGRLIALHTEFAIRRNEPQFASKTTESSFRIFWSYSENQGDTWTPARQVVHRGAGFDATRWLPGIEYGKNGAYVESSPILALDDGSFIVGIVIAPLGDDGNLYLPRGAGYWYETGFLRGRWNADRTSLDWELGGPVRVSTDVSSVGCCESDMLRLRDGRLFATMRCQGDAERKIPSSRVVSASSDGGKTWTEPKTLAYEDGSPVHTPAAYSAMMRSPQNGKAYWIGNILDHAVYAQYPRVPLCIAEIDESRLCLMRESVCVVQALPAGAPPCTNEMPRTDEECGRQYTNFGYYVDRTTGELVLIMPEMPRTTWAEFTSDCVEWRVSF